MGGTGESSPSLFDIAAIPRTPRQPPSLPGTRDTSGHIAAREMGGWTLNKLEVLSAYLRMYRRVAGSGTYIDAFSGAGHAVIKPSGRRVAGSPIRAAESDAFRELHFFEFDRGNYQALKHAIQALEPRQRDRCRLWHQPADSNVAVRELLRAGAIDPARPCFAFLDPNSTELGWDLVAALAAYKSYEPPGAGSKTPKQCKIELWILLNTHQALTRLWPSDRRKYVTPPHAHVLDFMLGGRQAWFDLWLDHTAGVATIANRYAERLMSHLGYRLAHAQAVRDPQTGAPHYYMIHASDHPNAHTLMRSAKKERMRDDPQFPGWRNSV